MRPRVLGRNVILLVNSAKWLAPIPLGELEEFSATSTTEIIKSRPVGYSLQAATLRFGGYDLTFKIGKTDPFLARWSYLIDRGLISGSQPPELFIIETIQHYDKISIGGFAGTSPGGTSNSVDFGNIRETWIYKNVTLYAPDFNISAQDAYEHSIKGFAAYKELGPIGTDTTALKLQWVGQLGFQEVVAKTANVKGGIVEDITGAINSVLHSPKPEEKFLGDAAPSVPGNLA